MRKINPTEKRTKISICLSKGKATKCEKGNLEIKWKFSFDEWLASNHIENPHCSPLSLL